MHIYIYIYIYLDSSEGLRILVINATDFNVYSLSKGYWKVWEYQDQELLNPKP